MSARVQPVRRGLLLGLGALALAPLVPRAEGPTAIARVEDLRPLLARVKAEGKPLLLFFSTVGCPYCLEVRRNYLVPRFVLGAEREDVLLREVDVAGRRQLTDRDGTVIRERALAERFGARMVPVVVAVDAELRPLAPPMVGIGRAGFYDAYLTSMLETATGRLRKG